MELVYSGECPYCRAIVRVIDTLDVGNAIETKPIEEGEGREMVVDHHGDYVHAPHLFTEDLVYYGVLTTAKGVLKEAPKEYLRLLRG